MTNVLSLLYQAMVIATYPVIKTVNPNVTVVTAGLSPGGCMYLYLFYGTVC